MHQTALGAVQVSNLEADVGHVFNVTTNALQ